MDTLIGLLLVLLFWTLWGFITSKENLAAAQRKDFVRESIALARKRNQSRIAFYQLTEKEKSFLREENYYFFIKGDFILVSIGNYKH